MPKLRKHSVAAIYGMMGAGKACYGLNRFSPSRV